MSLTTVTVDDFSSLFAYAQTWTAPDTSARGYPPASDAFLSSLVDGSYHQTTVVGASVSLNFTGPSVELYGVAGPSAGFYSVALDGATSAPLSAYSAANTSHYLLWSDTTLTNTPHSLTLTNLGASGNASAGSTLMLDFASVTATVGAAGATLTNTTVDDLDRDRLTYTGGWSSNNDTRFVGNTSTYTNENGGSVSMNFTGSACYVWGDTVDDHGYFRVKLDNKTYEYNGKTAALKIGTLKFFAGDLDGSPHSLTIINLGTTFFDLDYITYTTPSAYSSAPAGSSSAVMIFTLTKITTLCLLPLLVAGAPQYGAAAASTKAQAASASSTAASGAATHVIQVGQTGLLYTPTSVQAETGDSLIFEFASGGHSVTQSSFGAPCAYSATGLDSGIIAAPPASWVVTVETTDPLWFSCRQRGHCGAGMVFAVNPPTSGNTYAAFLANAKNSSLAGTFTPTASDVLSGSGVVAATGVTSGFPSGSAAAETTGTSTSASASAAATSSKGSGAARLVGSGLGVFLGGVVAWAML